MVVVVSAAAGRGGGIEGEGKLRRLQRRRIWMKRTVKNGTLTVKNVLEKFTKEEVRKMREKVIEYIPRLVYANTKQGLDGVEDAFDVAIEGVFKRIKEQEQPQFHKWK